MTMAKLKWNQTPEGRRKQAEVMKATWAKKKGLTAVPSNKETDENTLIRQFSTLQQKAEERLVEIDNEISELTTEKKQLLRVFKGVQETKEQE